jgi:hypothetical protein
VSDVVCVGLDIGLCAYSVDLRAAVGVAARAWLGSRRRGREVSRVRKSERARDWTVDRHSKSLSATVETDWSEDGLHAGRHCRSLKILQEYGWMSD